VVFQWLANERKGACANRNWLIWNFNKPTLSINIRCLLFAFNWPLRNIKLQKQQELLNNMNFYTGQTRDYETH